MNYGEVRHQAAEAAWKTIRHLLHPDTVHLLSLGDIADAITAASDILAPAEQAAVRRRAELLDDLDKLDRENMLLRSERDTALRAADDLAYAVAALTGEDIGRHTSANDPWKRALDILDAIAEANHRPRPSDLQYTKAAACA